MPTRPRTAREIADAIAPANYLNQPPVVVEQALTGTYADGLGNIVRQPDRAGFDPFPWQSFGVWILTQMKRWGQVKGDVDYAGIAQRVLLATDAAQADARHGPDAARGHHQDLRGHGQALRPRAARGLPRVVRDQARLMPPTLHRQRLQSLVLMLGLLAVLLGAWQIAATPSAATGPAMDPEYAKLMGAAAQRGQVRRCRGRATSQSGCGTI